MAGLGILELCAKQRPQLDPVSLRRIFLLLVRNHYADPENNFGGVPDCFKQFKYSDNDKERQVNIELDYVFNNYAMQESRPGIYVGFSDFQFQKQVINNYIDVSDDMATETFFSLATTQLQVQHLSAEADEALQMATITTSFFRGLRKVLMANLKGLKKFEVETLSKVALLDDEADKHFQANMTARLVYHDDWETSIESHRIKKISFELNPESC
jgi:hypothetical protein